MDQRVVPPVPIVPVPEMGRDIWGQHPGQKLLDAPISFFDSAFANVPSQTTTLRRMVNTKYYRAHIESIRHEQDPRRQADLKKHLPAFTLAWLNCRRKEVALTQQVRQQWPLLMGDIDQKDNPGLDMTLLKGDLGRLPYVLLCASSVRGGLWFVIRLPDGQTPATLLAHFAYVKKLFADRFGIILDQSKGGNPTHLRYVSYDPAPYVNDAAIVLQGTYTEPPVKVSDWPPKPYRHSNSTVSNPLQRILQLASQAAQGERHRQLLKAARLAGGYIAAGHLQEQDAVEGLEMIASEWPNFAKSQRTIRDGIRYGQQAPVRR